MTLVKTGWNNKERGDVTQKHYCVESNLESCRFQLNSTSNFCVNILDAVICMKPLVRWVCVHLNVCVYVWVYVWDSVNLRSVDGYLTVRMVNISRLRPYHVCTITAPFAHYCSWTHTQTAIGMFVSSCIIHIKKIKLRKKGGTMSEERKQERN